MKVSFINWTMESTIQASLCPLGDFLESIQRNIFFSANPKSSKNKMSTPLLIDDSVLHGFPTSGEGRTRAFTTVEDVSEVVITNWWDLSEHVWERHNLNPQQLTELQEIRLKVRRTKVFKFWLESKYPGINYWEILVAYTILRSRYVGSRCRSYSDAPIQFSSSHWVNLLRFYKTNGATLLSMEFLVDPMRCCSTHESRTDPPNGRRRWQR
jgi:hypothetical protein